MKAIFATSLIIFSFLVFAQASDYNEISQGLDNSNYFDRCNNIAAGGTSIPFDGTFESHTFRPECAPEILYSWRTIEDWTSFSKSPFKRPGSAIYAWRTPLSTFGYGEKQIRIKLKPNVQFKWITNSLEYVGIAPKCPVVSEGAVVYVRTLGNKKLNYVASEYILCSLEAIESWSTNTEIAFKEAKREFDYIKNNSGTSPQKYDAYGFGFHRKGRFEYRFESNPFFFGWLDEETDWELSTLERRFDNLDPNKNDKSELVYTSNGIASRSEVLFHFSTNIKSYFGIESHEINEILDLKP